MWWGVLGLQSKFQCETTMNYEDMSKNVVENMSFNGAMLKQRK